MTPRALPTAIRFRVAAIIVRSGCLLLSRALVNPFWELPGGRVEPGEMSGAALLRELREELGAVHPRLGRLVFVFENRFVHEQRLHHEVNLTYEAQLSEAEWPLIDGEAQGAEPDLRFRWVAFDELAGFDLRPRPLHARLLSGALPEQIEHFEVDEWPPG